MSTVITANLVGVGGTPPYTFAVQSGLGTDITASITGSVLTVDAAAYQPGAYTVTVGITDSSTPTPRTSSTIIPVRAVATATAVILNTDISVVPTSATTLVSVPLQANGVGTSGLVWSINAGGTSLPRATITGATLNFVLGGGGPWTVALVCTYPSGGGSASINKTISVSVAAVGNVTMVDGQVQIPVTPEIANVGVNQFSLVVADSTVTNVARNSFPYTVAEPISSIEVGAAVANHDWASSGDTTSLVYPILGDLTGFAIGPGSPVTAGNGLTVTVDSTDSALVIAGPPTGFSNSEINAQIILLQSNVNVAYITRMFTLLAHNSVLDIGTFTCNTRPYQVSKDFVGLNPLTPYFNSPQVSKQNFGSYTVRVQAGTALPTGLSLDANTGLVYGTILSNGVLSSTLEYVDSSNGVHGIVLINWDICGSSFTPTDNLGAGTETGVAYSGTLTNTSAYPLTAVSLYRGRLPLGLTAVISGDNQHVTVAGTAVEAGYFDIWFRLTNSQGQFGFYQKRFVSQYVAPLVITTQGLAPVRTGILYEQPLFAVGGELPYTWSLVSGTLPTGITLVGNQITGTTALTVYSAELKFEVTDARGVNGFCSQAGGLLGLAVNNTLEIVSTALPLVVPSQPYSFQFAAQGGAAPYTWTLASGSPALPSGVTLSSTGLLSGVTTVSGYTETIVVKVTDASSTAVTGSFSFRTGSANILLIDTSGVGPILLGADYQGLLRVDGPGVAPYTWSVTSDSPNTLTSIGMYVAANPSSLGATAMIAGVVDVAPSPAYSVKMQVTDSIGNTAFAYIFLTGYSSLEITTVTPLPQATVGGAYSLTFTAHGVNPPYTWALQGGAPALAPGLTLSSGGVLAGTPTAVSSTPVEVQVTDAIGTVVPGTFGLLVQNSTLAISTSSLAAATAGIAYTTPLVATGGVAPFTYSISPLSAVTSLPSGLSISPTTTTTGTTIQGTTSAVGTYAITFRVTDSIGNYIDRLLPLVVASGLTLHTGVDYNNGTSTACLGYVDNGNPVNINPRPNGSFYVVATGVLSTQASTFNVTLPTGYSVYSLVFAGSGIVFIVLEGPFSSGAAGSNPFTISVNDSGVTGSATFNWTIVSNGVVYLTPGSGTHFPPWYLG